MRWLCVEGIGLNYRLDAAQLTLALDFPPELFGGSATSLTMDDRLPVTYARGGFLNYDLRYDRTEDVTSLGANWEIGAFARPGLFTSSFFSGNNDHGTVRLDTAFRRDDPERITSAVAGDTITRSGSYGAAVRMGGLQYQRNFGTAPLLITYPTADVGGTAVVPSTVDVYINNAKAYSAPIKPGPFSVQNLPVPVGAGNVRVVVRDVFGKESTAVVPYVRYDSMLKQGLHDFSYETGFLRRDYAIESNNYGDWAAVGTHRYGVTNWLTLEGHAEIMDDRGNLGGVVQVTMPVLGLVGVGGALSTGDGTGKLGKVFFQRNERNWTVGAAAQQQSENYLDVASEPGTNPHARHAPGLGIRAGLRAALAERAGAAHDRPDGRFQYRHPRLVVFADGVGHADCEPLAILGHAAADQRRLLDHAGAAARRARLRHRFRRAPQQPVGKERADQRQPQPAGNRQLRLSRARRRAGWRRHAWSSAHSGAPASGNSASRRPMLSASAPPGPTRAAASRRQAANGRSRATSTRASPW